MSGKYEIREVKLTLKGGAEVCAHVDSVEGIKELLHDMAKAELEVVALVGGGAPPGGTLGDDKARSLGSETPLSRVETKASLASGVLALKKVTAFKDEVPQLLRPGSFANVTDAVLALVFALETGLQKPSIDYESFKSLFEAQNIKSGSPLRTLLTNLRNAGYLDKGKYAANRSISLTGKGEAKAIEVLRAQCE